MMKKVMVRAWEIAREGQRKFGGKVSEYLSESLKIAWAEQEEEKVYEATLPINNDRLWIAEITGTHPRFKLDRQFLNDYYLSDNGYYKVFDLSDGLYAIKGSNRGGQTFFKVINGDAVEIDYNQAIELAKQMDNQVAA